MIIVKQPEVLGMVMQGTVAAFCEGACAYGKYAPPSSAGATGNVSLHDLVNLILFGAP